MLLHNSSRCKAFENNLSAVRMMGFNELFIRKWRLYAPPPVCDESRLAVFVSTMLRYLRYCQAAFQKRHIGVVQAVYVRSNTTSLDD